ncbi:MAG: hypothetical protein QOJ52_3881 [Acidimicrobiaceae bacterium]|nr:hypothetical protein [Acidimicrobiaceae bacterium]
MTNPRKTLTRITHIMPNSGCQGVGEATGMRSVWLDVAQPQLLRFVAQPHALV